jgi:hypothetical protein
LRPDFRAQRPFARAIFVVLRHRQDVGTQPQEVILEIQSILHAHANHDFVHHVERRNQRALVVIGQRAAALLVPPEDVGRGE